MRFIVGIVVCIFISVVAGCTTVEVKQTTDVGVHQHSDQAAFSTSASAPTSGSTSGYMSGGQSQSTIVETHISSQSQGWEPQSTSEPTVEEGKYMHFPQ